MTRPIQSLVRRRWPLLILTGTLVSGATVGALRVQALVRAQLPQLLSAQLESALGRPVHFGRVHVGLMGVWVDDLRVPRIAGEPADPLSAKRLRVAADWWRLLTTRQLQVQGVDLDGARVRLAAMPRKQDEQPWTAQVLRLSATGIERFGVHNASVEMLPTRGQSGAWTATGVGGDLRVRADEFTYGARLAHFSSADLSLQGVSLAGTGSASGLHLRDARATYHGVEVQASGDVRNRGNAVAMTLRVRKAPLSKLAAQLGIPAKWAVDGNITGAFTVDARNNDLHAIRGTLTVNRGSLTRNGGKFPWTTARADLEWTPAKAVLRNLRLSGKGLSVTAEGSITTAKGQPMTAGRFALTGDVVANESGAVAQVAELLAFRRVLDGRWQAARAALHFRAGGTVGDLAASTATGRLHLDGLRFRPMPTPDSVTVHSLDAELERTPTQLVLRGVRARTEGLSLAAEVSLTDDRPGAPGQFRVSGSVGAKDLKSLRTAIPHAELWQWIPVASPAANGSVQFTLGGPTANPAATWSRGRFQVSDFRLSAHSSLPSSAMFFIPVKVASGAFRQADGKLAFDDVQIAAQTFNARGRAGFDFTGPQPMVETALQLTTDDWRSLPAMPAGALPELQGGRLVGSLTVAAPVAHLATAPVDGSFRLTGASYLPAREGATPIPVSHLAARFRWAQQVLELPSVSVATDLGGAKANGRIYPRGGVYRMALDLTAQSADAGELAGRFTDELRLVGGEAQARLSVDAPVEELRSAAVSGTVDLKDARVIRAVEALGLSEIDAKSLHVTFGGEGDRWNVQRLAFNSPGLDLTASGNLAGGRIDAEVALNTDRWVAPKTLPVAGGALGFRGRVQGSVSDPHTLALAGDLKLDGAHLRHSDPRFALNGGVVSMSGQVAANAAHPEAASFNGELKVGGARVGYTDRKLVLKDGTLAVSVRGEGPISDPMRWVHTGEATLTDAHAAMDGREPQRLDRASARFVRDGDRFRWTGAQLAAAGVTATSDGEWSPAGHTASVTADVQDLARWGFKLPEGIGAKQYRVVARLAGTPENPLLSATGRLELEHLRVALQGAPPQVLDRVAGDFSYSPDGLRVTGLEGRGPAGTITASGEWAEGKQHLSLVAVGTDPAQLGFALPEGFRVKGFRLQAEVDGADARSVRSARGSVQLWNAQFPFGPGAAHHLDTVSAQLQWDGKRVVLSGIEAEGPVGKYTGSGEASASGYRLALVSPRVNPDLARWMLPGTVIGGALSGTLVLQGNGDEPLESASGHFELVNAQYSIPADLGLVGPPVPVSRFAGDYRWADNRAVLTGLVLNSDAGSGTGTLTVAETGGEMKADFTSRDIGRIVDFWPMLAGRLRGGAGTGRLEMRFDPAAFRGTLAVENSGGTLVLPSVPAEYAEHPISKASLVLGFEPNKLSFRNVKLRGPRGNADGEGVWTAAGPVYGSGKTWFTKSYTSQLIKPSGFGWLAKLVGVRQIQSDFSLSGSADRVTLNAGITRSFLWKFAKGQVPKEFQQVARGKSPLWVAPLEVAQVPPAASPARP